MGLSKKQLIDASCSIETTYCGGRPIDAIVGRREALRKIAKKYLVHQCNLSCTEDSSLLYASDCRHENVSPPRTCMCVETHQARFENSSITVRVNVVPPLAFFTREISGGRPTTAAFG